MAMTRVTICDCNIFLFYRIQVLTIVIINIIRDSGEITGESSLKLAENVPNFAMLSVASGLSEPSCNFKKGSK